jgi:hypothetical protein
MKRRKFLSILALAPTTIMASPYLSSIKDGKPLPDREWDALKKAWKNASLPPVAVYLKEKSLLSPEGNIARAVSDDFRKQKVLSVDGLLLSQTEVAFVLFAKENFQ